MRMHFAIKKEKIALVFLQLMVCTLLISWISLTGMNAEDVPTEKNIPRIIAAVFGIIGAFLTKNNRASIYQGILFIFVILLYLVNQNPLAVNVAFLAFYAFILSRFEKKSVAIVVFVTAMLGCEYHLYLLMFGKVDATVSVVGDRLRYLFGFANPNQLSALYVSLIFSSAFLVTQVNNKTNKLIFILCVALSLPFIYLADSRTGYGSVAFLVFWSWLIRFRFCSVMSRGVLNVLLIFAMTLTYYLSFFGSAEINEVLSNRPQFFNQFVHNLGTIDLLIGWQNHEEVTIDNVYLLLFSAVGMPLSIILAGVIFYKFRSVERAVIPLAGAMLLASLTESFLLRPELPAAGIFLSVLFSRNPHSSRTISRCAPPTRI